jgi:DNA-binding NarL/FixJ family response regulator
MVTQVPHNEAVPPDETNPISVLTIDESAIFRVGLRSILAVTDGLHLVGEFADPAAAVDAVVTARPDIVLLGVGSPGCSVEEAVSDILAVAPDCYVIVLGLCDDARLLQRLMNLGVRAFLPKDVPHRYLISFIYTAKLNDRRMVISPRASYEELQPADTTLSAREREVIELVAKAMTNAQIGRELRITEGTVKRHLRNVFIKLHAVSRLDAVNKAIAASLIE